MNFILLAAGHGQRMGNNKALMQFNAEPWVLTQLRQIGELGLQNITIVTNPESEVSMEKLLCDFSPKVLLITNPKPEKGPFSSLQLAIAVTPEDASFVSPIDVPLKAASMKKLRQAWLQHGHLDALIPSYHEHKGHPVILSTDLQRTLLNLSQEDPNARLDFALKALPENKKRILALEDPYITFNLNTPEDLAALASDRR